MGFFKSRNSKGKYKNRGWLANSQNEAIELQRLILTNLEQLVAIESRRLAIEEIELRKATTNQQWHQLKEEGFKLPRGDGKAFA